MTNLRRRSFLQSGAIAAGAAVLADGKRVLGANERLSVGVIGTGGRGGTLARAFALRDHVRIACFSDPDTRRGEWEFGMLKEEHNPDLYRVQDCRQLLEDRDIDAVIVATPDHWHALGTVWACQAGKDVYVEKPSSHNIWEGRKMVEAARKYERVVQVGTQSRSAPYVLDAIEYIRSGGLGRIHLCRVHNLKSGSPYHEQPQPAPPELDLDLWLGPAPLEPYHAGVVRNWYYHWDFCGGDLGNDGVHQVDLARLLIDKPHAISAHSSGGNFAFDDDREVPDTQVVTYTFDDMLMTFEMTQYAPYMYKTPVSIRESDQFPHWPHNSTRIELYGTERLMVIGRHGGGWQVFEGDGEVVEERYGRVPDSPHIDNFLECVRTRQRPNTDIEEGHRSAVLVHMGNIAYRLGGRALNFDADAERFDDADANAMLKRDARAPFMIPDAV